MGDAGVLLIALLFLAFPVLIALYINGRFKRSRGDRLDRTGLAEEVQTDDERPIVPFSSPERLGKWTKGFLAATFILAAFAIISGEMQIALLSRAARGFGIGPEEASLNDLRQGLVGMLQVLLYSGTGIIFLIWFHRMHRNLPSLGETGLIFTPGWAVGFFFVPFFNLVRPFQAMRELWHGSDPGRLEIALASDGSGGQGRLRTPPLVGWWWALFLAASFVENISARLLLPPAQTLSELRTSSLLSVAADLLLIPSALVAILLVGRLTRWQVQRAESIQQRGGWPVRAVPAAPATDGQRSKRWPLYVLIGLGGFALLAVTSWVLFMSPPGDREGSSFDRQPASTFQDVPPLSLDNRELVADVTQRTSGDFYGARGEVVNRTDKTFHFVMVKVEFCDKSGRVVSTLTTEGRADEHLLPRGRLTFAVTGHGKIDYETVRASVVYSVEEK